MKIQVGKNVGGLLLKILFKPWSSEELDLVAQGIIHFGLKNPQG